VSNRTDLLHDRIRINSILIVLGFVSVLALSSQSAASYATYLLALSMLLTVREWTSVLSLPLLWLTGGLLGYLFLSSFWSEPFRGREAFSIFIRVLLVFLFVVAVAEAQHRGHLRQWLRRALTVAGIVAVSAALAVFYATDPEDGRLQGLGQLRAHVVAALIFGAVLIFALDSATSEGSRLWRALGVLAAVLVVWAVFLSDSRNAWVSVSIGASVFLLARLIEESRRFFVAVTVLLATAGLLIFIVATNDEALALLLPRDDSYRLAIWTETVAAIRQDGLWFGLGINTPTRMVIDGFEFLHPHNLYLAVAYQGGLIGLVLFLALLGHTLTTLMRHYPLADAKLALGILAVALPAYLVDGYELVDKVGAAWLLIWLPVGISLGLSWRAVAHRATDDTDPRIAVPSTHR
jgi:O-antigen ligase